MNPTAGQQLHDDLGYRCFGLLYFPVLGHHLRPLGYDLFSGQRDPWLTHYQRFSTIMWASTTGEPQWRRSGWTPS
jgi:hypothetical protein